MAIQRGSSFTAALLCFRRKDQEAVDTTPPVIKRSRSWFTTRIEQRVYPQKYNFAKKLSLNKSLPNNSLGNCYLKGLGLFQKGLDCLPFREAQNYSMDLKFSAGSPQVRLYRLDSLVFDDISIPWHSSHRRAQCCQKAAWHHFATAPLWYSRHEGVN